MILNSSIQFSYSNLNLSIRDLNEAHVSQEYVDGLVKERTFIETISNGHDIQKQKDYVRKINESNDSIILGLFSNEKLIGTSGIQTNFKQNMIASFPVSTIGMIIFDNDFRGKGLGKVIVWSSIKLISKVTSSKKFGAGMRQDNLASYKSFISLGFEEVNQDDIYFYLYLDIKNLIKPQEIYIK